MLTTTRPRRILPYPSSSNLSRSRSSLSKSVWEHGSVVSLAPIPFAWNRVGSFVPFWRNPCHLFGLLTESRLGTMITLFPDNFCKMRWVALREAVKPIDRILDAFGFCPRITKSLSLKTDFCDALLCCFNCKTFELTNENIYLFRKLNPSMSELICKSSIFTNN